MTVGVLLLAGGSASRFGADKRLAPLVGDRSLLDACIDNVLRTDLPLLVCLGPADGELAATLSRKGVPNLACPHAGEGMGSTLADGVAAIASSWWSGALVALADMPLIRPGTYRLVAERLAPGTIVTVSHNGRRGHPVGFDRAFFPELEALRGDKAARSLLTTHAPSVMDIPVEDPGILLDVDLTADLDRARAALADASRPEGTYNTPDGN